MYIKEIDEINMIMDKFTRKIVREHHKEMDGVWGMRYDVWTDVWQVGHFGYWLDDIVAENKNLLYALQEFKEKINIKINEEIDAYDFKNHCVKDV